MQTESRPTGGKALLRVLLASVLLSILVSYPKTCSLKTGDPQKLIRVDSDLVDLNSAWLD